MSWVALGAALFFTGLLHRLPAVQALDASLFRILHRALWRGYPFFRVLWLLGTTPATLFLLFALIVYRWQVGLIASLIYALAALLERSIKKRVRRVRPFQALDAVHMTQPRRPSDPSFPSGDALRVWFLVFVIAWTLPVSAAALWTLILLAALVSLGRIALGAHYPLDVLAGSGLGLFFAAWLPLILS